MAKTDDGDIFNNSGGIASLIYPNDVDSFLLESWARAACLYPQSLRNNPSNILSLETFELMLGILNRAHEGWLHFARGGLKQVPHNMVDEDGMLDMRKIRNAFSGGETLYLTKAERLSHSLMHLCRSVELDLIMRGIRQRKSVNAHVFLTPPGSQGFPLHRDEHASFVLQLEGSKEWTVYEPGLELTASLGKRLRPGGVDPSSLGDLKKHTYYLEAGDVLYMPEWWPHEARASISHSLHVTLRIFPLRWIDLMLELCPDHPALSAFVPRDATDKLEKILDLLVRMLRSEEFVQPLPNLFEEIGRRHMVPKTALPDDSLRQVLSVDQVRLETLLVHPSGSMCTVFETEEEVYIRFPGGLIRGPSIVKEVFEYVARTPILRPQDFPPVPGSDYDRIKIAQTMVSDGLLRIANLRFEGTTKLLNKNG